MKFLTFLFLLVFLLIKTSLMAQNYHYALEEKRPVVMPDSIPTANDSIPAVNDSIIVIPPDFDWGNIPADYANSIWEIRYAFNLKERNITLPDKVSLRFKGGTITHGTLAGSETHIASEAAVPIFDALDLDGTYKNEFLYPYWFGAKMDGKTDDRTAFVETLTQAENIGAKVMVDRNIFLDVAETGKKSIFLESNTHLEGSNDANIIINNLLSPAFYMALTENIVIKNITFLYDQKYDAGFGWSVANNSLNSSQLERYLTTTKNIRFNAAHPMWRSPSALRSVFLLDAAKNILFDGVTLKAKGTTADTFMVWGIKLKEQFTPNQTVSNTNGNTDIPRNITLKNVTMDGVIMGIQGIVDGFKSDGLQSLRYSDVQNANGSNLGGGGTGGALWMPPPHLFYLNSDKSKKYNSQNIEILNTMDKGEYVGTEKVRPTLSGYCNSLKLVDNIINVRVDSYTSYRRDGIADLGNIERGSFKNMYAENNSSIFDPSFKFNSLRFLGTLINTSFENITVKDNAVIAKIYPFDITDGNGVTMDNINVFVNELNTSAHGPFGINGSNNKVENATLTIQNHTTKQPYRGVVFLDNATRNSNGSNNHYDITVKGWRNMDSEPSDNSVRILLQQPSNRNSNSAKVTDLSNNFISVQTDAALRDTWIRSETVTLGHGKSQELKMNIPHDFKVESISTTILESLATGANVSIGTSATLKDNLMSSVSMTAGKISNSLKEPKATKADRPIYLHSDQDFGGTGKIEVSVALVRVDVGK